MELDGTVYVLWASPALAEPSHVDLLTAAERDRWERFARDEDRRRFLVGRALLRLAVAASRGDHRDGAGREVEIELRCDRCGGPHGKPRVSGGPEVSLSHAGAHVVLALTTDAPLGVDVEAHPAPGVVASIADTALTPAERGRLDTVDDVPGAFAVYWCRKEAVLKATGEGLAAGLNSIEVSGPDEAPTVVRGPAGAWLHDLTVPGGGSSGYAAALALLGPARPVIVHRVDAVRTGFVADL